LNWLCVSTAFLLRSHFLWTLQRSGSAGWRGSPHPGHARHLLQPREPCPASCPTSGPVGCSPALPRKQRKENYLRLCFSPPF